ncbi:MAG TPA: GNAT family N-acetyltransferase [Legionella sp.]|nr:GNAT family N-acetyltransferase [Legionella sp.]
MILKCIKISTDDLDEINLLMHRSKAHWGYNEAFMNQFMQLFQIKADYLEKNTVKLLGEFSGTQCNKMIGFYSFGLNAEGLHELDNFFIDPEYIGKGFGKKMWHRLIEDLQFCDVKKFTLWSDPGAESFYKKMGCIKIGVKKSPMMPNRYPVVFEYSI